VISRRFDFMIQHRYKSVLSVKFVLYIISATRHFFLIFNWVIIFLILDQMIAFAFKNYSLLSPLQDPNTAIDKLSIIIETNNLIPLSCNILV